MTTPAALGHADRCPSCGASQSNNISGLCGACLLRLATLDGSNDSGEFLSGEPRGDSLADSLDDPALVAGQRIGNYELLDEIARGGMGVVYRARQLTAGRIVAVKVMLPHLLHLKGMLQRFRLEIEAIAKLDHPGILPIYEVGEHSGLPFFSMKFAEGGDLAHRADSLRGDWRSIAQIVSGVAHAIEHAHQRGVVHRDLKPANILFDAAGVPMVADYGLAKFRAQDRGLTLPATALGSPQYMAPEQVSTKYGEIGPASDIYSLGAVLYELLTGQTPIAGGDALQTLGRVVTEVPASGSHLQPNLPRELDAVALKCLQKRPEQRYASAADVARDLERWLAGREVSARSRLRDRLTRRPMLAIAAGIAVIVVSLVSISLHNNSNREEKSLAQRESAANARPLRIAVLPFISLAGAANDEYLGRGITEEVIGSIARLGGVRVLGRNSAYALQQLRAQRLAVPADLKLDYELAGSVQRSGEHVVISTRLLSVPEQRTLRQKTYEIPVGDLATASAFVTRDTAESLGLSPAATRTSTHTPTADAYRLFLEGRVYAQKNSPGGLQQAIDYFKQAIAADPDFALAHASLAMVYMIRVDFGGLPVDEATRDAQPEVERARSLDPELVEAQAVAGLIDSYNERYDAAATTFRRITSLRPDFLPAHVWLGRLLYRRAQIGRALAVLERADELDPLSQIVQLNLYLTLEAAGRFDEALRVARRLVGLNPQFANGLWVIARAERFLGQRQLARQYYEQAAARASDLTSLDATFYSDYAGLLTESGELPLADHVLRDVEANNPANSAVLAARLTWTMHATEPHALRTLAQSLSTSRLAEVRIAAARAALAAGESKLAARMLNSVRDDPVFVQARLDPWEALAGRSVLLDEAAAAYQSGDRTAARAFGLELGRFLVELQREGLRSGGIDYLRAGELMLRGERQAAAALLQHPAIERQMGSVWIKRINDLLR